MPNFSTSAAIGGNGDKMALNRFFPEFVDYPLPGRMRVKQRFLRRKSLRIRRRKAFGPDRAFCRTPMMSKASALATKCVSRPDAKGLSARTARRGPKSEPPMPMLTIGAERLAGRAFPFSAAHVVDKSGDALLRRANLRHDVEPIDQKGRIVLTAQGSVQDGAIFGRVDFVSGKHARAPILNLLLSRKREQKRQGLISHVLKGVIKPQAAAS